MFNKFQAQCKSSKNVITKKDPHSEGLIVNGAGDGLNLEPKVNNIIVEFLYLCLHDEDTIEQVKDFLIICNTSN